MIVKKNKEKVKENFVKGKVDEIEILTPNIADKVMTYADEKLVLDEIINKCTKFTTHEDGLPLALFMYSLLSAKLKRLFSISSATVALTAESLVEKFKVNIKSEKGFTDESNIRKFIKKMCKGEEVKEEEIEAKIKEIEEKNKKQKNEKKKKVIDREKIKLELQIKKDGHNVVTFFNDVMKQLRKKIERPKIHILDCVKIPVNYNNPNYELATTINYEGTPMKGYKMGVLRGVTSTGGVIEYLIDDTISTNDMALVEKEIVNYDGFEKGDYLLADRGFIKIEFITDLVNKCINVIIPAKKNMDIFKECIKLAKAANSSEWKQHPNPKRKGQDILLIKNLKGIWVTESDKNKKPEKMMKNAVDFVACVIRIEKSEKENKDIIAAAKKAEDNNDETDIVFEDDKYIYLVILSTDTTLTAANIIRLYEMRPEIEEDFRQLKDILKMCTFTSTKYIFVMCQICFTFLAYNLFNLFKNSDEGKEYTNKSMKKIAQQEQRYMVPFNECSYIVVTGGYYSILNGIEFLDLYAESPKEIRNKLKKFLT